MSHALPPGFGVVRAVDASGRPLTELLQASQWRIELPGVAADVLPALAGALRDAATVEVSRQTRKGERRFDVRAAVISVEVVDQALQVVLRHTEPLVRPDDVFAALQQLAPAELADADPPRATRLRQGPLLDDRLATRSTRPGRRLSALRGVRSVDARGPGVGVAPPMKVPSLRVGVAYWRQATCRRHELWMSIIQPRR